MTENTYINEKNPNKMQNLTPEQFLSLKVPEDSIYLVRFGFKTSFLKSDFVIKYQKDNHQNKSSIYIMDGDNAFFLSIPGVFSTIEKNVYKKVLPKTNQIELNHALNKKELDILVEECSKKYDSLLINDVHLYNYQK